MSGFLMVKDGVLTWCCRSTASPDRASGVLSGWTADGQTKSSRDHDGLLRRHRRSTIRIGSPPRGRGADPMGSAGRRQCPGRGRERQAPVIRLGRRNSHAGVRIPLHQVLEDVRRQGDLRRTRPAPLGEVPSLRQHRRRAAHLARPGEDLEEVVKSRIAEGRG